DTRLRQRRERRVERLTRRPPLVFVLAPPPKAMVLLRKIRQLEVEAEGTQHLRLPLERQFADDGGELGARPRASRLPRLPRQRPDALRVGEQLLAPLLEEDTAEDLAEQPDVPAERCLRVA